MGTGQRDRHAIRARKIKETLNNFSRIARKCSQFFNRDFINRRYLFACGLDILRLSPPDA
jgi:hypothetical protein